MLRCNLSELYSLDEYRRVIADYAAANPDAPVDHGRRLVHGRLPRRDADERGARRHRPRPAGVPDEPRRTRRVGQLSRARSWPGITRDTPDPADGRIERTPDGEPSGTLHEGAMTLVEVLAPQDTDDDYAAGLRVAQTYLHSLGITAWQDAIVGIDDSYRTFDTYVAGGRTRGAHRARRRGALVGPSPRAGADRTIGRRASAGHGRAVRADQREDHAGRHHRELHGGDADAVPRCARAADREPGISFVDPELLKEAVTQLDALGFQAHFHALGDRAVRESLDAIEAALIANGPSDNRHHLAHIQIVHPDDIPRFRRAGRGRERPAAVGRARGPDGQPDDPVHRARAGVVAVPVREPRARRRACSRSGATGAFRAPTRCWR